MQARKAALQVNLEKVCNFSKNNRVAELRELLAQQETRLSGHHFWDYHTDDRLIEGAARDAILAQGYGRSDQVPLCIC